MPGSFAHWRHATQLPGCLAHDTWQQVASMSSSGCSTRLVGRPFTQVGRCHPTAIWLQLAGRVGTRAREKASVHVNGSKVPICLGHRGHRAAPRIADIGKSWWSPRLCHECCRSGEKAKGDVKRGASVRVDTTRWLFGRDKRSTRKQQANIINTRVSDF